MNSKYVEEILRYGGLALSAGIILAVTKFIYAIYFGPTSKLPGPWYAKITSIPFSLRVASGDYHKYLHELHTAYGPVIEFAPRRVSVIAPDDVHNLHKSYKFSKSEFYSTFNFGGDNVFSTRNQAIHAERNKILTRFYSVKNCAVLEAEILDKSLTQFLAKLRSTVKDGKCEIYDLLHQLMSDIIGRIGFGRNFDMFERGLHPVFGWVDDALHYGIYKKHIPLVVGMFKDYFGFQGLRNLEKFGRQIVADRKASKVRKNDVLQAFFDSRDVELSDTDLMSKMVVQIGAGPHNATNMATWVVKQLLNHPHKMAKVVKEIDLAFPARNAPLINSDRLRAACPYFVATVEECMQFTPATSGNKPRVVPKGGAVMSGHFIPGGLEISHSPYAYNHSPSNYAGPERFNPSRFLNPGASDLPLSMHFLMGPCGCTGRNLAMIIVHITVANLLHQFNVAWYNERIPVTEQCIYSLSPKEGAMFIKLTPRC